MSDIGPASFAEILSGHELPLIIGGQAVNVWAELYAVQLPELEAFGPFTSKDADIYGTRELAATLARRAGWECSFLSQPSSILVAKLVKRPTGPNQQPLTIEVLSEVNGLTDADLSLNSVVRLDDGLEYRIPAPPVLLKAKIYNLISLVAHERPQDLKHTQMLMRIVPQYLNELLAEYRAGHLAEDNLLGAVNYTRAVVLASFAVNAARPHSLDFRELFPQGLRLSGPQSVRDTIGETDRRLVAIYGFPPSAPD